MTNFDVVVVGSGPAGMAAASVASMHGSGVCLIDDNAKSGGQIWRGRDGHHDPRFASLQSSLEAARVDLRR